MSEETSALFLCPNCGAFVDEKSEICLNCGAKLDDPEDEEIDLELDELIEEQDEKGSVGKDSIDGSEPEPTIDEEEPGTDISLFLCSECGAFTAENEKECTNCGAILEPESDELSSEADEHSSEVDEKPPKRELEDDLLEMLVLTEEKEVETVPDVGISKEDEEILDKLKEIESPDDVASLMESIPEQELDEELDLPELQSSPGTVEPKEDILLDELITLDKEASAKDETARVIASVEKKIPDVKEIKPSREKEEIGLCSECGAFASSELDECGVCGIPLTEETLILASDSEPPPEKQSDSFAQKALRRLFGVSEDAELKPLDTTDDGGSLGICTVCGAFLSERSDKCGICDTYIEDMPEFVTPPMKEEDMEEVRLTICPNCSAFLSQGATTCSLCGAEIAHGAALDIFSLDKAVDDEEGVNARMKDADAAASAEVILRKALGVIELKDTPVIEQTSFKGTIDLCPDCGAFVSPSATRCAICGSTLVEDIDGVADDILDLESTIEELASIECPNCNSTIAVGSAECPLCGLAFETDEIMAEDVERVTQEETPGEDITEFLEKELPMTIRDLEERSDEPREVSEPDISLEPPKKSIVKHDISESLDIADMLVQEDEDEKTAPEIDVDLPVDEDIEGFAFEEDIISDISETEVDIIEPEPELPVDEHLTAIEDVYVDEPARTVVKAAEEPVLLFEVPERRAIMRPAGYVERTREQQVGWKYGVYASVAAVILFLVFHILAPGNYSIYLALIFGTILATGIYLLLTEKENFVRADLKRSLVFSAGNLIVVFIVLHWTAGIMTSDTGILAQPGLDRMLFSLGILLIGMGMIWMRKSVRNMLTWFNGTLLLFLSSITYSQIVAGGNANAISSTLLVGGTGAALVFISLGFLSYERAIRASMETDIVRGDGEYLRKDFSNALASYDSALGKVRKKRKNELGGRQMNHDMPWYSKGSALILLGKLEEGIENLEMALAINPDNEVAWVNKGNAHSRLGQHEKALECFEKAVHVNPNYEIAWNNMGNVLAREKKYIKALKCYNTAIKINPRYGDVWINKGYVLVQMGKRDQALECINRVRPGTGQNSHNGIRPVQTA